MARRTIKLDEIPSNSKNKVVQTVSEPATVVKKSGLANDLRNISSYLFSDVLLPILKDGITQVFTNGLEMMLYGDEAPRRSRVQSYGRAPRRDYARQAPSRRTYRSTREHLEPEAIYYASISDAKLVLGEMQSIVAEHGVCTVGDMYTLSGVKASPIQHSYGWDDLSGARTVYDINGYYIDIDLPPSYLNR